VEVARPECEVGALLPATNGIKALKKEGERDET